jgi:hypothetical protein
MLIFIDRKAPEKAKINLRKMGEVIDFETSGICYEAISGHPDIFFFQHPEGLIIAPNTPEKYKSILNQNGIAYNEGELSVGTEYPQTAHYNALFTKYGILHNNHLSDPAIKGLYAIPLHCKQGYVRCTTIQIADMFVTSDQGIGKLLRKHFLEVHYIDPQKIILQGFRNGFIGGCCGVWEKSLYLCGSFRSISNNSNLINLIHQKGYNIVDLYDGPMIDVGGIFFISPK